MIKVTSKEYGYSHDMSWTDFVETFGEPECFDALSGKHEYLDAKRIGNGTIRSFIGCAVIAATLTLIYVGLVG